MGAGGDLKNDPAVREVVYRGLGEATATSVVLSDATRYPHLAGQQPDLYRGFIERTRGNASQNGVTSLIHPESHFTEKKAAPLRRGAYLRLRRHWQFVNELVLFDIAHIFFYGVHTYGLERPNREFVSAVHLYHHRPQLNRSGTMGLGGNLVSKMTTTNGIYGLTEIESSLWITRLSSCGTRLLRMIRSQLPSLAWFTR